jgi:integrase
MAGRPPLPIGSHGGISRTEIEPGIWQAETRYRDADGVTRKVRARGTSGAKAEAALRGRLKERRLQGRAEELSPDSPMSELLARWLEQVDDNGDLTDDTKRGYRDLVERIVSPGIGAVRIRELNTQRVDMYLRSRSTRVREVRVVLSQVCAVAVRWGLLEYNPVRDAYRPTRAKSDKRTMDPEDVPTLIARAQAWQARKPGHGGPKRGMDIVEIFILLMATGERIGEVLALRWVDVEHLDDLTQPAAVTVAGTVTRDGKRKPFPKTEHGYRRLLLPEYGREALLKQRERGLPFELVFPSRLGTPRWPNNVRTHWRTIRGEDFAWVTPKTFRKTAATAIERKFGAEQSSKQMGHSSPDVTRKHYIDRAHQAPDSTSALEPFNPFPPNKRPPGGHLRVVGEE